MEAATGVESAGSLIDIRLERRGFSLSVEIAWQEDVLVLFGPSGSGKSTLLECVLGLHPDCRARIRLGDEWLDDSERGLRTPVEQRALGWVPQAPTLFPHLDVAANLAFGRARANDAGDAALTRAIEVLELGHLLERRVGELSGGERSRVALGRALASGPRALLLDEPLAALDLPLRARVLPHLLRVRDEIGLPIIYITHDPDEALVVGGRVAVLDQGRLVASGPAREVLWSRAVLPLSEALGIENVLDARALESMDGSDESRVETAGGLQLVVPWRLEPGTSLSLGLPAEDVLIALDEPGELSARNVLRGRVLGCEERDDAVLALVDVGEPIVAKLTHAAVARLALVPGRDVYLVIKAHSLRRVR